MKRFVLMTLGLLLMLPAGAQIMKSQSTTYGLKVVPSNRSSKNTSMQAYIGLGCGPVNTVEDFSAAVPYFAPLFVEAGVMRLMSDVEGKVVPFVGVDLAIGLNLTSANVAPYFQSGPSFGLLLGKPSFRFDLRLQPSFSYAIEGYRQEKVEYSMYGTELHSLHVEDYGGILLATEASVWISRFNIGIRYIPLYKGIMGHIRWRF